MKHQKTIMTLISAASTLISTIRILKVIMDGEEDRRQIRSDGKSEIEAIRKAREIVEKKIDNGDYEGKTYEDAIVDLQFYTIVNRPVRE